MKNTAKKLLSLLLCLVMALSFFPASALAEEGEDAEVIQEEENDCGHAREDEGEDGEAPDDTVGDDAPGVPEDEDEPEEAEVVISEPIEGELEPEDVSSDYQLTGDPRTDLLLVALAQEGKTAADFGFTVAWCAYFVSWCGRIAAPDLFPFSLQGYGKDLVAIMANNNNGVLYYFDDAAYASLNNGNTYVDFSTGNYVRTDRSSFTPEPGDLITFCNSEYEFKHIGIVCAVDADNVYYIDGNGGGDSAGTTMTRPVRTYVPIARDSSSISTYLRPNYDEKNIAENDMKSAGANSFGWPVTSTKRINVLDHYSSGGEHGGIDISAASNSNVYSVAAGTVVRIGNGCSHSSSGAGHNCYANDGWGEYGNYVVLKHVIGGTTYTSVYAHLTQNSILVSVGDSVTAGQLIARSGSSGSSTGPHLHLEIYEGEFRGSIKTIRSKSFQYYLNNTEVLSGMTFSSHINTSSVYFGSWVEANCELNNGVWKYVGNQNTDPPSNTPVAERLYQLSQEFPSGSYWTDNFDDAIKSYGFAGMIVYRIFGASTVSGKTYRWWNYAGESESGMVTVGQVSTCTGDAVRELLRSARPGDVLQFNKGTDVRQHSMIIYSLTATGAVIYECNWSGDSECYVAIRSLTFEELAARQTYGGYTRGTLSLLTSDNWDSVNGSAYTCIVSYDAAGGTGAPAAQTKAHAAALTLSTTQPSRASVSAGSYTVTLNANGGSVSPTSLAAARTTSYSFRNWNTSADGSGISFASGASYTINASATLYAQWNSSTSTAAVTLPTPTRTGYSFKGWATSASATSGTTGSYTPTGNVTLYAIWQANPYTISYDANGGTGAPAAQTKLHDVALTLSTTKPTRANASAGSYTVTLDANGGSVNSSTLTAARTTSYTFSNWNTAANGSGTTYASGASYTANAAATLYAQWNSSTATAAVTLPTPTREGFTFKGWATSASATSGTTGSYTPTDNVTLYAVWEQNMPETDSKLVVGSGRVRVGQEIQVPVRIEENPGVVSIEISVHYDETVLEWTAVTAGEYGGTFLGEAGEILTWYADDPRENETKDGVFATLTFRVKDDAAAGTTQISVSYDEDNIYNADEENQPFQTVPGEIEIFTYFPGDINGDGIVSNKDLTRLQRYLRGQNLEVVEAALDVNGDGKINNKDATRLQRYLKHGDVEIY